MMAIDCGDSDTMYKLGCYYDEIEDYDNMIKYYNMAIDCGNSDAMYRMGQYYENIEMDYDNMKKYYTMAIECGNSDAMYNIKRINRVISQIPKDNVVLDDIVYLANLGKRMTCCVCHTNEINTVFNCRHLTCGGCSRKIKKCGLCRAIIYTRTTIFI
jgi:hypothetical protein